MKSINVAELKDHLSLYLDAVKAGEEILVHERDLPIARIIPCAPDNGQDTELLALAAAKKIRLGEGSIDESFWDLPAPRVPAEVLRRAVEQERDEE